MAKYKEPEKRNKPSVHVMGTLRRDGALYIIAIKEFKHAINGIIFYLPTDGIGTQDNPSELPLDAALRSLWGQTGYEPGTELNFKAESEGKPILSVQDFGPYWPMEASCTTEEHLILAMGCRKNPDPKSDKHKVARVVEILFDDWLKMIASGEVRNEPSIVLTMRALPYLRYQIQKSNAAANSGNTSVETSNAQLKKEAHNEQQYKS